MMKFIKLAIAFFIALSPLSSHAGGGGLSGMATEVTQLANNVELALQSMQAEMQTLEMIEQTYLQRLQQFSRTIEPYAAPFRRAMDAYNAVRNAQRTLTILQGRTEGLQQSLEYRARQFGASNLSWNDWMTRERNLIAEGNQNAQSLIIANNDVVRSVQEAMDSHSQAIENLNSTTGIHDTNRIIGSSINTMGQTMAQLLSVTTQGQTLALQRQADNEGRRTEELNRYEQTRATARQHERDTRDFAERLKNYVPQIDNKGY